MAAPVRTSRATSRKSSAKPIKGAPLSYATFLRYNGFAAIVPLVVWAVAIARDLRVSKPSWWRTAAFSALADPTRRAILARLALGEATVMELVEPFEMTQPAISRHLKVLEHAGLIVRSREAQWRPSRLQADPLDEAVEWMQSRKRTWEARMDRLEAHLRQKGEQDE